ncbi:MAG: hypothetical protein HY341_00185, partial [Candidatus Kerfeldbacteria bacterium]|nr:hypothetical protein [Candidatus Kerfeldbacteria bacterium]
MADPVTQIPPGELPPKRLDQEREGEEIEGEGEPDPRLAAERAEHHVADIRRQADEAIAELQSASPREVLASAQAVDQEAQLTGDESHELASILGEGDIARDALRRDEAQTEQAITEEAAETPQLSGQELPPVQDLRTPEEQARDERRIYDRTASGPQEPRTMEDIDREFSALGEKGAGASDQATPTGQEPTGSARAGAVEDDDLISPEERARHLAESGLPPELDVTDGEMLERTAAQERKRLHQPEPAPEVGKTQQAAFWETAIGREYTGMDLDALKREKEELRAELAAQGKDAPSSGERERATRNLAMVESLLKRRAPTAPEAAAPAGTEATPSSSAAEAVPTPESAPAAPAVERAGTPPTEQKPAQSTMDESDRAVRSLAETYRKLTPDQLLERLSHERDALAQQEARLATARDDRERGTMTGWRDSIKRRFDTLSAVAQERGIALPAEETNAVPGGETPPAAAPEAAPATAEQQLERLVEDVDLGELGDVRKPDGKPYTAKELRGIIDGVRSGELPLDDVPSDSGIRDRVRDILGGPDAFVRAGWLKSTLPESARHEEPLPPPRADVPPSPAAPAGEGAEATPLSPEDAAMIEEKRRTADLPEHPAGSVLEVPEPGPVIDSRMLRKDLNAHKIRTARFDDPEAQQRALAQADFADGEAVLRESMKQEQSPLEGLLRIASGESMDKKDREQIRASVRDLTGLDDAGVDRVIDAKRRHLDQLALAEVTPQLSGKKKALKVAASVGGRLALYGGSFALGGGFAAAGVRLADAAITGKITEAKMRRGHKIVGERLRTDAV